MRWMVALPALVLAALVAGCGPGTSTTAPPQAAEAATTAPSTATEAAPPTHPAGSTVAADGPPAARLQGAGLGDPGVSGAEGSFTWDGFGSEAPWIVQPEPVARGAGPWTVALDPQHRVERWTARWAPVANGIAADPETGARGTGQAILVQAPGTPGTWSLQLEAGFGAGRQVVWYWTIDVQP